MWGHLRSNVIGYLALFVALSGTAYAAALPRDSVGTQQLRKGAVRPSDVKDRAIQARHLAAGVLRTGPAGPAGAIGPAGAAGPVGPTGPQGPPGPVDAAAAAGSTAAVTNDLGGLNDAVSVTTSRTARLLVTKVLGTITVSCTGSSSFVRVFATLDTVPVPGSTVTMLFPTNPASTVLTFEGLTLSGVTADPVAAGAHTVGFGADCVGGTTAGGSSASSGSGSLVLLG